MEILCSTKSLSSVEADSIVLFVTKTTKIADRTLRELDQAANGAISTLMETEEFTGKEGETVSILCPDGYLAKRFILVGLGGRKSIDMDSFRRAGGTISQFKGLTSSASVALFLGRYERGEYFQAAVEGIILGGYKLLDFKTGDGATDDNKLEGITIVVANKRLNKKLTKSAERGRIIAEGQVLTRRLAATPGNSLTPKLFVKEAQKLARKHGFEIKVLDEKDIAREKMGALQSVAQGSVEPARFMILKHNGAVKNRQPVVLVGKGVTFDSGGISLKPGLNMHEMKGDMAGAAAVLASVMTAARLKLPINLVGLIPACENMPSSKATRPGDIITTRKGLTVEVINTDAEGRLILADALDYASKFNPQAVIDIATLTGASLYILGYAGAPVVGNNRRLMDRLRKASKNTAEKVWELPIWEEHRDQMKSRIADLVNSGGRPAGTIAAAAFLENFIGDWPWAHVDIAYVDVEPKGQPYVPAGTTGFGIRLLIDLLSDWKKL